MCAHFNRIINTSVLATAALVWSVCANGGTLSYDLATQWSPDANPNGAWSYNQNGAPLPFHQNSWSLIPGLNGWTTTPSGVSPPGWFLVTDASAFATADVDDITVHSSSSSAPLADVTWTSCAAGAIDVSGQAWDVEHFTGRDDEWTLLVDDVAVAMRSSIFGIVKDSDTADFASNIVAGQSLTGLTVAPGDAVTLRLQRSGSTAFGHFTGVDLSIDLTSVDDSDNDGIDDTQDNCVFLANADQTDTNNDGFGNACDPDIGSPAGTGVDDGQINFTDLVIFKDAFFSNPSSPNWNPDADFTGDNTINFADLSRMKDFFFGSPGPSCLATVP